MLFECVVNQNCIPGRFHSTAKALYMVAPLRPHAPKEINQLPCTYFNIVRRGQNSFNNYVPSNFISLLKYLDVIIPWWVIAKMFQKFFFLTLTRFPIPKISVINMNSTMKQKELVLFTSSVTNSFII